MTIFIFFNGIFAAEPFFMHGDSAEWNQKTQELWVRGSVAIWQNLPDKTQRHLECDSIHYNRSTDKITAFGSVKLTEPSGDVVTADQLELDSKFNTGIVDGLRVFTADAARLSARKASRSEGNLTIFEQADYTPCKECPNGKVTWKLEAEEVEHDQVEHTIKYRHVYLVFKGFKVLYMPYFSHPDPKVKRKSGFLASTVGMSKDLGVFVATPYLCSAKDQDLTITPMIMSKQNPLLAAEYRKRFINGEMSFGGSGTRMRHKKNAAKIISIPKKDRWNVSSTLSWHMTDANRLTLDINRASDTTYLSKYRLNKQSSTFSRQKNLTSTINFEHFGDKAYASAKSQVFQTDTPRTTPVVLPYIRHVYQTNPFANASYLVWDSSVLGIFRKHPILDQTGKQTFRSSSGVAWKMPYVTSSGHIFKTTLSTRGDAYVCQYYNPNELNITAQKKYNNHVEFRMFPQGSVDWRYPLLSTQKNSNWVLEPRGLIAVAPTNLNRKRLPNEDSRMFTLDDTSIFLPNRFDGIDLVDEGARSVLGADNILNWGKQQRGSLFMGQSYRLDHRSVAGSDQGEGRFASDYIARVLYEPNDWWVFFSRGSFMRRNMSPRYTEVGACLGKEIFKIEGSFVHTRKGLSGSTADISQVNWQMSSVFTDNWKASVAQISNTKYAQKGSLATFAGLAYEDDCFTAKFSVYRSKYTDRDIRPDTGFLLQFNLKNLGSITPSSAPTYPGTMLSNLRRQ